MSVEWGDISWWLSTNWNKELKKKVRAPIEFKETDGGFVGAFRTKDDIPVAVFEERRILTPEDFRPLKPGFRGETPPRDWYSSHWWNKTMIFYPKCYCATFIGASIPTTIIAKNIGRIFTKRVFIPYSGPFQNAEVIFKEKIGWNPLVERLNKDKRLRYQVGQLSTEVQYSSALEPQLKIESLIPQSAWISFEMRDKKDTPESVCQLIPTFLETLVVLQFMGAGVAYVYANTIMDIFRSVRGHILDYGYQQSTSGETAQPYPSILIETLSRLKSASESCQ